MSVKPVPCTDPISRLVASVRDHLPHDSPDETRRWPEHFITEQLEAAVDELNRTNRPNPLHLQLRTLDHNQEICVIEGATALCLEKKALEVDPLTEMRYRNLARLPRENFETLARGITHIRPSSAQA